MSNYNVCFCVETRKILILFRVPYLELCLTAVVVGRNLFYYFFFFLKPYFCVFCICHFIFKNLNLKIIAQRPTTDP